jgi:signal transduction histidine kinase
MHERNHASLDEEMTQASKKLDLQAKISLVLAAVILPIFLIVTVAENKIMLPILEQEIQQIGINAGKTLAAEIDSARLLSLQNPTPRIENSLQEILYSHPDIVRIDVFARIPNSNALKWIASNIEEDPNTSPPSVTLSETVTSEFKQDQNGGEFWEVNVPIEHRSRDLRVPKRILGMVHVVASTQLIGKIGSALWKTTAMAAAFSVVSLILILSYFLRKTIENDRRLIQAESHNVQLTEQLHHAHRQIMTNEKLAVMGQLTASFAHEIGTPLNAIGGHLQLLREEIEPSKKKGAVERLNTVNGQLRKIEEIVKSFLQSTAKPAFQRQLVDLNQLADRSLEIVRPRILSMSIDVKRMFNREMGPLRLVPLDIEQILLNLLNNSLDSIQSKMESYPKGRRVLGITTHVLKNDGNEWAQVEVYDTGEGISKADLKNVMKPFFTTKRPGEGTGLGLTICQQIVQKYGGELLIDSKEGAWTRITIQIPFQGNV